MKVVVIGNGPAAIKAVKVFKFNNHDAHITMISREQEISYAPYFLAKYVCGESPRHKLYVCDANFYKGMDTVFGEEVVEVIPEKEKIKVSNGKEYAYEKLLIAAGANALIPPIHGLKGGGVFTFKTLEDAEKIMAASEKCKKAVVMGGGFIGLEIAEALRKILCGVTVIERENRLLPRMLDQDISHIVRTHMEKNDITIRTNTSVVSVNRGMNGELKGIETDKGETHECDILVVASGVVPNLDVVQNSSIAIDKGIIVDQYMRTNIPNIYAAGDIAEVMLEKETWMNPIHINAAKGGQIAGLNMMGKNKKYESFHEFMNVVTLFGLSILSLGVQKGVRSIKHHDSKGIKKIYFNENGEIQGVQLIGDVKQGGVFLSLMEKGVIFDHSSDILKGSFNYPSLIPLYF